MRLQPVSHITCRNQISILTYPIGQSASQLQKEFKDIRETYNGRYVRLYGACDNAGFYDDVVDAAWDNGLGVHSLIWVSSHRGNPPIYIRSPLHSSASLVAHNGKPDVTPSSPPSTPTPKRAS